jgi:VWFA-related protein
VKLSGSQYLVVGLILFSAFPASGRKRQNPASGFEIRSQSQIVNLTIVATDKNGRPVTDLKSSDVEVREDGKPQTLQSFESASPQAPVSAPRIEPSLRPAPLPLTSFDLTRERHVAFVFDNSSTTFEDRQRSLEAAGEWIRTHRSGDDEIGIFSLGVGVKVWQPFTRDARPLLAALDAMHGLRTSSSEDVPVNDLLRQMQSCKELPRPAEALECGRVSVQNFYEDQVGLLHERVSHLQALVRLLGLFPGEKRVIYFGDGFMTNPGELAGLAFATYFGDDRQLRERLLQINALRAVTDAALRSNVTFYTIDAHGLREVPVMGEATQQAPNILGPEGSSMAFQFWAEREHAPEDALHFLANDTGGREFSGDNDLAAFAARAIGDIAGTYYASYSPTDTRLDGNFRKITIRSRRDGIVVRTRAGYFAMPVREFSVRTQILSTQVHRGRYLVPVQFSVNPGELDWHGHKARRKDQLVIAHRLIGPDGQLITSRVQILSTGYPQDGQVKFALGWALQPGDYTGVLEITEASTSNFGVANFHLKLPPL